VQSMESEYWKEKQPQPGQSMCAWAIVATLLLGFQAADVVWSSGLMSQAIQTADVSVR
jgi:hypothetical protein